VKARYEFLSDFNVVQFFKLNEQKSKFLTVPAGKHPYRSCKSLN
jgi:hypothetical protein